MAEGNGGSHLTPTGGHYGFLPFVVTSSAFDQSEVGNTVSALGASMGLTNSDVNGNASHIFFSSTGGMQAVDYDSAGHILSLATRSQITTGGVVSEPGSILLAVLALSALGVSRRRR
jgi:uncharacterized protein (TIGR03382 family)